MFDRSFSKIFMCVFIFVLIVSLFLSYSSYSDDKFYLKFVNQVKLLKQIVLDSNLGLVDGSNLNSEFFKQFSSLFDVVNIEHSKVILISSYKTEIYVYFQNNIWAEIKTVSVDGVIPVKNIIEIDSFLDDGLAGSGMIYSMDGKYYSGCVLLIKNR